MPFVETGVEFEERHGGKEAIVYDEENSVHLFPDGAWMEENGGRRFIPSRDEHERAKVIARYWEIAEEAAEQEFEDYKAQLKAEAFAELKQDRPPLDRDKKLKELERLRDEARKVRDRRRAADKAVERTEPAEVKRQKRLKALDEDRVRTAHQQFDDALRRTNI